MLVKVCKTDRDLNNPIVSVSMSRGRCEDGKVFINGVAYPFDHYFWVNDGEEIDFIQEKSIKRKSWDLFLIRRLKYEQIHNQGKRILEKE